MRTTYRRLLPIVAAMAIAASPLVLAACGDDEPAAATAPGQAIDVTLGSPSEFTITPSPGSVAAGEVTISAANRGSFPHEMVLIRTNAASGDLAANGEVDETGLVGELEDLEPGAAAKELTATLETGHYVILCNLPGHYAKGMHTDLTVE